MFGRKRKTELPVDTSDMIEKVFVSSHPADKAANLSDEIALRLKALNDDCAVLTLDRETAITHLNDLDDALDAVGLAIESYAKLVASLEEKVKLPPRDENIIKVEEIADRFHNGNSGDQFRPGGDGDG